MKYWNNRISPIVVSLVGCSNSGKTTLLEKLIQSLKDKGYRVGTVKHHRGAFELDIPGKDTWRHAQAGADVVALATPGGLGIIRKLQQEPSLKDITDYMSGVDIVLVEGIKKGSQPKIEVVRSDISSAPVCSLEDLTAVVTDLPLTLDIPVFDLNKIEQVADFIEDRFLKQEMIPKPVERLTAEQLKRYHRNIKLPGVGQEGQIKLLNSSVLVVGAGGLGSPVSLYLAAAGIGRLGLADEDSVDLSNLQRQIVHATGDIGRSKVESARDKLTAINPDVQIEIYHQRITADNVDQILNSYDLVVDATDNLESRYLLNKACIEAKKPFIYGGVLSMVGQVMTILPGQGPCFRCIFREGPSEKAVKSTADVGILGAVAGTIGCLQSMEAIKCLLNRGNLLVGRILTMDGLSMSFQEVEICRDPECPDCGHLK
ncbi:molybdopterin-guanine dinucleotide biosynthesis protein B [Desulforamulus ruminis]|uniref:Molybdopterin-guanine dinucleotide biosynthesis protein B n=1 Tax=Desulforamulus ruminis (strain ATCC 23193 / DSM 2154 / NCIMB 8452 / DL) TaxID=696281 RepID=F6DQ88_DESRL|nr:molybdopterin-guanine dinucleotide biosynthesis protein B [Desulforamulus ruminis]AEG59666.1 molybdopterin-guanine dinucleotide biosynthesis protein B [Desulforamulus ruminis DSM 2154]